MHGTFITLEGVEGCGKSTQARRLAQALRDAGREVVATREPGGTPLADSLRALFLDAAHGDMAAETELLLVTAGRADHVRRVVRPALERGAVVVCDRFVDSTRAYQGGGRGLDRAVIDAADGVARGGLLPDVTLLLDVPAEDGIARAQARHRAAATADDAETRFDAADLAFHRRIRSAFLRLASEDRERVWVIDATGDEDDVFARVTTVVRRRAPGLLP